MGHVTRQDQELFRSTLTCTRWGGGVSGGVLQTQQCLCLSSHIVGKKRTSGGERERHGAPVSHVTLVYLHLSRDAS